jgi:hypothetical protein
MKGVGVVFPFPKAVRLSAWICLSFAQKEPLQHFLESVLYLSLLMFYAEIKVRGRMGVSRASR